MAAPALNTGFFGVTGPIIKGDFFATYTEAATHYARLKDVGFSADLKRKGYTSDDRESVERMNTLKREKAAIERAERQSGGPSKDSKARKQQIDEQIAAINADREQKRLLIKDQPRNRTPDLDAAISKAVQDNAEWQELDWRTFDNGASVPDNFKALGAEMKEGESILHSSPTIEEVDASIDSQFDQWAEQGKLNFENQLMNVIYSADGGVPRPNPNPHLLLPPKWIQAEVPTNGGGGIVTLAVDDTWAMQVAFDTEGKLRATAKKWAREAIQGKRTVATADKARLLAEQEKKIWHARRVLEASCVRAELEGKMVKRPSDTPFEILLWIERATPAPKPKLVATDDKPVKIKRGKATVDPATGMTMPSNPEVDDFDETDFG